MKKVIIIGSSAVFLSTTGCSAFLGESLVAGEQGRIMINADADGMRSFSDLLAQQKAGDDSQDSAAYYNLRREQTAARALRYTSIGTKSRKVMK